MFRKRIALALTTVALVAAMTISPSRSFAAPDAEGVWCRLADGYLWRVLIPEHAADIAEAVRFCRLIGGHAEGADFP